ncbi:protein of unknown function [Xenorhabdus poinarii G6]|uniref:Uncharacterized protein n=1 Tax=Xenorhabdus poinarii G6 TaxID=1354304 RepID=A0A068R3R6_9GAMM|nr:protein of unknown function [Xenorhabdus poinarii G6]
MSNPLFKSILKVKCFFKYFLSQKINLLQLALSYVLVRKIAIISQVSDFYSDPVQKSQMSHFAASLFRPSWMPI